MTDTVLEFRGLTKHYGSVQALNNVNLTVARGEVFGFLGPNGAGKSTAINLALGLLWPTRGEVTIMGQRITPGQAAALQRVGALLATPGFVPYLSGRDNLKQLARLYRGARVDEALQLVSLEKAADRRFSTYSLGMKQRLGLAAALIHRPALLVLDEPTNGLDPGGMKEVRELVRDLANQGTTVFLSSHLLHEVEQVCDRVAMLSQGRVVAVGQVNELLQDQQALRIRVKQQQKALDTLNAMDGVRAVAAGDYLSVHGIDGEDAIRCLWESGVVPSEVTPRGGDLESLFLQLTGEGEHSC